MGGMYTSTALLFIIICFGFWDRGRTSTASSDVSAQNAFQQYKLKYTPHQDIPKEPHIAIFMHAAVGIFKKKRYPNETWGYGGEILNELINTTLTSGLLRKSKHAYITALGAPKDVGKVETSLEMFRKKLKDGSPSPSPSSPTASTLSIVVSGTDLYVAEFPTLLAIYEYAKQTHDDSIVIYMHTKGMRNNGKRAADWRRYMAYWIAERYDICLDALQTKGYLTCGVLKSSEEYSGNFWWSKAKHLKSRPNLASWKRWNMENRMAAEDWLFHGVTHEMQSQHYCIHSIDHNMYDVPTPRSLYVLPEGKPFSVKSGISDCQIKVKTSELQGNK